MSVPSSVGSERGVRGCSAVLARVLDASARERLCVWAITTAVFREEVGPGWWWVEGFELPCEGLDGIDKLGHSELDRFERCHARRWPTEI